MSESIGVPSGFRDILFDDARARRRVESKLAEVFDGLGYGEIIPSSVEYFETYLRGDRARQDSVYRFLNRDDVLLALRADFTLSAARIVATRLMSIPPPYRMWYCGSVFRKADSTRGQYKEIMQVGAELLGANSVQSDAEILGAAMSCLEAIGVQDIQLHINHAGIFKGIVESLGLRPDALKSVKSEIDRKDMRALAARLRQLGVSSEAAHHIDLLSRSIGGEEVLKEAEQTIATPASQLALNELRQIVESLGKWKNTITFDLTEIDEMEYYTGIFFTFFSPKLRKQLGRGGRYDNMLASFGAPMPAVGFSLSIEELVGLV